MPEATLKFIAKLAGVAPVTVSRAMNGSENVAATTRDKILTIIRDLGYIPNVHAASLRRRKSNDDSASSSIDQFVCANKELKTERHSYLDIPYQLEEAFIFGPEELRPLAQQIAQLRRDMDMLRKHAERIQSRVTKMQKQLCSVTNERRPATNTFLKLHATGGYPQREGSQ